MGALAARAQLHNSKGTNSKVGICTADLSSNLVRTSRNLVRLLQSCFISYAGFALMKLEPPRTAQARREFVRAVTCPGLRLLIANL